MDDKTAKLKSASDRINKTKTVYHVFPPLSDQEIEQIKESGYFNPSKNALGGQSDGYYFFTSRFGADNHIKEMQDTWESAPNKHPYIIECEIDFDDIKYPNWKLDYEAMQDFMFKIIYDVAIKEPIKFDNIEIKVSDKNKLEINVNGKFSRTDKFNPNDHSGLIEKVSDFLYKHNQGFKKAYDDLLSLAFSGTGTDLKLYAVKTTTKYKISKITKMETPESPAPTLPTNSQINKFMARYKKSRG